MYVGCCNCGNFFSSAMACLKRSGGQTGHSGRPKSLGFLVGRGAI